MKSFVGNHDTLASLDAHPFIFYSLLLNKIELWEFRNASPFTLLTAFLYPTGFMMGAWKRWSLDSLPNDQQNRTEKGMLKEIGLVVYGMESEIIHAPPGSSVE